MQFWGEPDHYAMGQLAGQKAVKAIEDVRPVPNPFDDEPVGEVVLASRLV